MRTLTAGIQTAVAGDGGEEVYLISLDFSGGTTYLTNGGQDILWSAHTYQAVGGALQIGNVEESPDSSGQGVELQLSGVNQTVLAALLSNDYRGRVCTVYKAWLSAGAVIADPVLYLEGLQLSAFEVEETRDRTGGTVTIKTRIKGRMGVDRTRGIVSSVVSHQHYFSGDTFFQNTALLASTSIYWGSGQPMTPGGGSNYPGIDPNPHPGPS